MSVTQHVHRARRWRLAVPALALLSSVCEARAQDASAPDSSSATYQLSPIVVTPTRLPLPLSEVASSVTVITSQEIEQEQLRTLPDVLNTVPGLNVVQTGGPGGTTSVFMRGTNANEVKVFIDGIDVSDPSSGSGAVDFGPILTSDIDRVEVLRGPQSGLYGASAIGGVINIITKTGSGTPHFSASAEGGSFDTFNQTGNAAGSIGRFTYNLDVAHVSAGDTQVTPGAIVPPGRALNDDGYDNETVSTKFGAKLTPDFDVGLVTRYVSSALDLTSNDLVGPETLQSEQDGQEIFTRGTAHLVAFDGLLDQTAGIAYTSYRNRFLDPNAATMAFGDDPSNFHGDRIKLDWQGNMAVTSTEVVTLGAEHQLDRINADTPVTAEIANDAGFAQLQSSFAERVFNTLSLRYDGNAEFGGKATYREAPAYLITATGTKLKATIGTGYNPPTLSELYENFPGFDFFGNPALKPETSLGYDAGFEQSLLDKRMSFGATWFHNRIKNLIEINAGGTTYVNVGAATTYGVESFVSYRPIDVLTLRADYTLTSAQDDDLHVDLVRRPRNKASVDAKFQATKEASFTATVLYVGPWFDVSRDGLTTGVPVNGYVLANVAGSYDFGHGVTGFARIDNLLNRHYQDPIGFQHQGLGVFAGVKVAFDAPGAGS